jgi:type II secretory pathway component PulF
MPPIEEAVFGEGVPMPGETDLHKTLKKEACRWLFRMGYRCIAAEVRLPPLGIIDAVGTGIFRPWHNYICAPRELPQVCFIEAKASRADAKAKHGKKGVSVPSKNLAIFTRQFSVMIDAGLPLVQCLEILGSQEEDKRFAEVILATRADVESGASLADAMKKHPKVFDPLYTNMIAAGEAGGILDTILNRLATYIEKAVKLKGQVKSAMVYPVAVIVIAVVVVGVILWKVITPFASLFAGLGAELPLPTRVVIALSDGLVQFGPFILVGIGAVVIALRGY